MVGHTLLLQEEMLVYSKDLKMRVKKRKIFINNLIIQASIGVYDHEKVIKLWMYLVDDAAKKYVGEFGSQDQDVKDMFPKETRLQVAQIIADREKENIERGEYDVVKGTVSPRG